MQTTVKNRGDSQGKSAPAGTGVGSDEMPPEAEPISARGLEILRVLKAGGRFAVEIGATQGAAVEALFAAAGADEIATHRDLAGKDRVVAGTKKPLGKAEPNR